MKWLILYDHLDKQPRLIQSLALFNEQGISKNSLRKQMPFSFRLYDDDGNLYYSGVSSDRDSEDAFLPLDWAATDSGCTRIDYLQDDGGWDTYGGWDTL